MSGGVEVRWIEPEERLREKGEDMAHEVYAKLTNARNLLQNNLKSLQQDQYTLSQVKSALGEIRSAMVQVESLKTLLRKKS